MRLLQSISFSTANLIDPLSEHPATEHAPNHLSLSRLDSLESELELRMVVVLIHLNLARRFAPHHPA